MYQSCHLANCLADALGTDDRIDVDSVMHRLFHSLDIQSEERRRIVETEPDIFAHLIAAYGYSNAKAKLHSAIESEKSVIANSESLS